MIILNNKFMRTTILLNFILFFILKVTSQDLTGPQLLEKSISYHDPSGVWSSFKSNFVVTMKYLFWSSALILLCACSR